MFQPIETLNFVGKPILQLKPSKGAFLINVRKEAAILSLKHDCIVQFTFNDKPYEIDAERYLLDGMNSQPLEQES